MTPAPTATEVTPTRAISLGFTQLVARWPTTLFATLATILEQLAGVVMAAGLVAWSQGFEKAGPVAMGASVTATVCTRLLATLVYGGAIRQSGQWLQGRDAGPLLEQVFAAAPRSLAWFALVLPLEVLATLWKYAGIAATVVAYLRAMGTREDGAAASAALAAFLLVSIPLALLWAVLKRAALAASVRDDVSATAGFGRAVGQVMAQATGFLASWLVATVAVIAATGFVSIFTAALTPQAPTFPLASELVVRLTAAVLGGSVAALCELLLMYGFIALGAPTAVSHKPVVAATT